MAYNKTKYVDAALKYLHQGKLAQAIAEYQQILKHEPRDQVTLMTVGDLFVRQGDTFQALEYFERLAQIYLADGFVTKAIAIYKKIAKLAPEESRPVEKLAELYVQQGVLSEARPIYVQLAEMHQRANRPVQAAALLRKLLEAEPDNLRTLTRLGELSLAAGLKVEAVAAFCAAARQLLTRGDHAEAIKHVNRALDIEPGNASATALKVRILSASGQQKEAIALLETSADLEEGGETAGSLLDLYLETEAPNKAVELASKIFARNPKHFAPALHVATAFLEAGQADRALVLLDLIREAMTDAGEHEALSQALTRMSERLPAQIEPLEWLVELYGRTSDSFRLPDALANLGQAHETAGNYDQALRTFEQLLDRDPENESARRQVERLRARLGLAADTPQLQPRTPSPQVESKPAAPPSQGEPLDEETQRYVTQALTDVDLFSSYGLTQKAMDLLETVLHRVPRNTVALERLLDLYLGAGNDRRTAELAAELEQLHRERGDSLAADRFSELCRRFGRAAAVAPPEIATTVSAVATPEFSVPVVEAEPVPEPAAEAARESGSSGGGQEADTKDLLASSVHEVDLSEEWATLAGQVETSAFPSAAQEETVVREANRAAELAAVNAIGANAKAEQESELEPEYMLELDANPSETLGPRNPDSGVDAGSDDTNSILSALSAEFDDAVPSAVSSQPKEQTPPPRAAKTNAQDGNGHAEVPITKEPAGPLSDVFNQFRDDLGETSPESEDLETHYNLGIAYREMGLLEEAISEFQKVAKGNNTSRPFRYAMQCCTLLGLAFIERGQPSIAAMWYERALETPGLDQESILALRYDLGVAQELAGDTSAARKSFSQVYGVNIDYRDVGERLAALGKER
jgi:pilus assembly protein FimV